MDPNYKKITESEFIIFGVFLLGIDGLCFLLDLTLIGAVASATVQGFISFWTTQWFKNKGDNAKIGKQIIRYFCGELPIGNFGTFIVSAVIHNNLNKIPAADKLMGKISKVSGTTI